MDKQLKPENRSTKKRIIVGIPVVLIIAFGIMNFFRKKQVTFKNRDIAIKTVKKGNFEDVIIFNSVVEPKTSVLVNVIEGGAVAEIFVESGKFIKKGTPMLRIYNPKAELNYLTQETAIVEQINNLRNIRVNIKNQQLNLTEQLMSIDNAYKNAQRKFIIDTTLYKKDIIARNEYETSVQEYNYQSKRNNEVKKSVSAEKSDRNIQMSRINSSIKNMQESLNMLRKNKENFIVKAPSDGLLSSFSPVLGKSYSQGESIGKIDKLNGYKLVAKVDEFYISKLQEEIKGEASTINNKYNVSISKIYTEVVNGQFEIELKFDSDSIYNTIKRGRTLKTKLFLSNNTEALLLPKGMFYQSTKGKWAFVLVNNNKAEKRIVSIGRENPYYYEVLSGLKPNDRIITSGYDDFLDAELVNIKN